MFGWFTKKASTPVKAARSRPPAPTKRTRSAPLPWDSPAKLPEVVEGNSDADWSAWQDSVNFQDSQMFSNSDLPTQPVPLVSQLDEAESIFEAEARKKRR